MSFQCKYCSKLVTSEIYRCGKCSNEICVTCADNTSGCHCGGKFSKQHVAGLLGQMFGTSGVVVIIIVAAIIYVAKQDKTSTSSSASTSYSAPSTQQHEENKETDLDAEQTNSNH